MLDSDSEIFEPRPKKPKFKKRTQVEATTQTQALLSLREKIDLRRIATVNVVDIHPQKVNELLVMAKHLASNNPELPPETTFIIREQLRALREKRDSGKLSRVYKPPVSVTVNDEGCLEVKILRPPNDNDEQGSSSRGN